jgi:hypothetical protein
VRASEQELVGSCTNYIMLFLLLYVMLSSIGDIVSHKAGTTRASEQELLASCTNYVMSSIGDVVF